uniref:Uncharacterized protein n=1 Tax=Mus musculus TaxID=10090 RepID=Q8C6K5_MOUSE|nr:unnamed protein product [Mus musculus]
MQRAIPRFLNNAGSWGSGTHCPRRWSGQLLRQQGGSYPEGAELRAVGPDCGWNPSGAARLRSPSSAGLGSCCWRDRVGSSGPGLKQAVGSLLECERRLVARRPGLLPGSPPALEAAAIATGGELRWSRGGSPGRCGPRDPAAGD